MRILFTFAVILSQAILSHLHIQEDNLSGFPLIALGVYFSICFIRRGALIHALVAGVCGLESGTQPLTIADVHHVEKSTVP